MKEIISITLAFNDGKTQTFLSTTAPAIIEEAKAVVDANTAEALASEAIPSEVLAAASEA